MDRDEAIRKIKRCLALSQSDNPTEAASALRQAQKLTEQLGIEQLDIQLSDVAEARARASSAKVRYWEGALAGYVADAFGCELVLSCGFDWSDFLFIGLAPAHELASYAHEVLSRQCRSARRAYVKRQPKSCKDATKRARGDAFAIGWVREAVALLGTLATTERNKPLLATYMQRQHPNLGQASLQRSDKGRKARNDDYRHGGEAGRQAQLHGGVGQRRPVGLLTAD
jgi:hypothetical protein